MTTSTRARCHDWSMAPDDRRGFTLIELLVAVAILLVLTGLTLAVFNTTMNSDRIRGGSRQFQSALLGARDRAIFAGSDKSDAAANIPKQRGLRLIPDPQFVNQVPPIAIITSLVFIQPAEYLKYNSVALYRTDIYDNSTIAGGSPHGPPDGMADGPSINIVQGARVDWSTFRQYFANPPRVRIPATTGTWYPLQLAGDGFASVGQSGLYQYLNLNVPFRDPTPFASPNVLADPSNTMEIDMANQVLPNSQPMLFPRGVGIILNKSLNVPAAWATQSMDILFSPRGTVYGPLSASGPIFFLIGDLNDTTLTNSSTTIDVTSPGEKSILTLYPQSGAVTTSPVDLTPGGDPFSYAKRGVVAGR